MEPYNSSDPSALFSVLFGIMLIPTLVVWLLYVIGMWKTFTKAGKPGWAAIIPIYNIIVMVEITGKPVWWFLLILFPCTTLIFYIWNLNLISKSFGKSEGFTVGLVILPFIFWPILGFGSAQYLGPSAKEAQAHNRFGADDYQAPFGNNNPQV